MDIHFKNYTKIIRNKVILEDINVHLTGGNIYGLYGKNGSGKTMFLRAVSGLILPTSGFVIINNSIVGKDIEFFDDMGVIIENMTLIKDFSAYKNLELLSKIKKKVTPDDIYYALESVGLNPTSNEKVKTFSLGMIQKLNIAQAIMEHPKLLLLDEPMNAVDNESVSKIEKLLIEMKNNGALIVLSSHNKDELNRICDVVLEMNMGRLSFNEKQFV